MWFEWWWMTRWLSLGPILSKIIHELRYSTTHLLSCYAASGRLVLGSDSGDGHLFVSQYIWALSPRATYEEHTKCTPNIQTAQQEVELQLR